MSLSTFKRRLFAFNGYLGLFDCDCACAAPPDFSATAAASEESARIMADLGQKQLDESKRQFDVNQTISKPVVDAQLDILKQTKDQGDDYYKYMVAKQRPVEDALNAEGMAAGSEAKLEEAAGKAAADARQGTTQQQNQAIRQGLRYGYSPAKMAATVGSAAAQAGLGVASAANNARERERTTGWAKKLDVAGLYRGLPGASQGAYSVANQSGNSAVANQMAPSNSYLAAVSQGVGTIGQGQQLKLQGLSSVLNAQTSYANGVNSAMASGGGGGGLGGLGSLIGAGAQLYAASDRRLKENIIQVGTDERTGLPLYEFNYIGNAQRLRGLMADDVLAVMPDAVMTDERGYQLVNYAMLGIDMVEV